MLIGRGLDRRRRPARLPPFKLFRGVPLLPPLRREPFPVILQELRASAAKSASVGGEACELAVCALTLRLPRTACCCPSRLGIQPKTQCTQASHPTVEVASTAYHSEYLAFIRLRGAARGSGSPRLHLRSLGGQICSVTSLSTSSRTFVGLEVIWMLKGSLNLADLARRPLVRDR